ncbi:MAG: aspartate kinase [Gemmatimonadota bacterium]|nr:aspartate kinase [Gemmatimonadota bacterium]
MREGAAPVVYKFGGSSLGDADRIRHVARLIARGPRPLVVVVSAMAGVTSELQTLVDSTSDLETSAERSDDPVGALRSRHADVLAAVGADDEATRSALEDRLAALRRTVSEEAGLGDDKRRADAILAAGEDLAQLVVRAVLEAEGVPSAAVDARDVLVTDDHFGNAAPDPERTRAACERRIVPVLGTSGVTVVQGFVGATPQGRTTTLGRGGSDFSAAILGGALEAASVHVWTDVAGILSADPRYVDHPRLLTEIGFEELVELAWAGARVIHPVAAKWAVAEGVPLTIRDTFAPEEPGTRVRHDVRDAAEIAAVTAKAGVALIKVRSHPAALPYGFLARVFGVLGRHRLEVDLVATSHSSTAFTIDDRSDLEEVAAELGTFAEVEVTSGLATITVVGRGLLAEPGVGGQVFAVVGDTPVHLVSQASDVSSSLVVDGEESEALTRRLHARLIGPAPADSTRRTA